MRERERRRVDDFLFTINTVSDFHGRKTLLLVENHALGHDTLVRLFGALPRIKNTGIVSFYEHQGLRLQPHYVGLQPLEINGSRWLTVIVPKGVLQESIADAREVMAAVYTAFHRFFQMRFSITPQVHVKSLGPSSLAAVQNPANVLVLLLAQAYREILTELCRRDFRRNYRYQEETFEGTWRGQIILERYVQNYASGSVYTVPCSYETFTADNLSNRILKCALMHLIRLAQRERLGTFLSQLLQPLVDQFAEIGDIEPRNVPFHQASLRHSSALYARALDMAEVIIGEHGDYSTGIHQSLYQSSEKDHEETNFPFLYNTYDCFEKFVERISDGAASQMKKPNLQSQTQLPIQGIFAQQFSVQLKHSRRENRQFIDFAIGRGHDFRCLGDAKYADCVDWNGAVVILNRRFHIGYLRQLYTYMRWKNCNKGLFVVPVWWTDDATLERARQWVGGGWEDGHAGWLQFAADAGKTAFDVYYSTSPLDRVDARGDDNHRVRFLGINMMHSPKDGQRVAARLLHAWMNDPI